jgi:hypothetical protein
MTDDTPPTREELIKARGDLMRQIDLVSAPMVVSRDRNPGLIAHLEAMVAEIDGCLAEMEASDSKRP